MIRRNGQNQCKIICGAREDANSLILSVDLKLAGYKLFIPSSLLRKKAFIRNVEPALREGWCSKRTLVYSCNTKREAYIERDFGSAAVPKVEGCSLQAKRSQYLGRLRSQMGTMPYHTHVAAISNLLSVRILPERHRRPIGSEVEGYYHYGKA